MSTSFTLMNIWASVTIFVFTQGVCHNARYTKDLSCIGKVSLEPPLAIETTTSQSACASSCEMTFQCVVFFYDLENQQCSLYNKTVLEHSTSVKTDSACYQVDDVVQSWAVGVNASSSYSGSDFQKPANEMLGPPDDLRWSPSTINQDNHIEFLFSTDMYIEAITIYESTSPGGVTDIKLLTPQDTWYTVWSTDTTENITGARIWTPPLKMTNFKTAHVRLEVGARDVWDDLDAVQVMGKLNRFSGRVKTSTL